MGSAKTVFSISSDALTGIQADGLIVPVIQKPGNPDAKSANKGASDRIDWNDALGQLDKALQGQVKRVADEEKFDAGRGKTLVFRKGGADKVAARRVILLGLGEVRKLNARNWESTVLKAVQAALGLKDAKSVAIAIPEGLPDIPVAVLVQGAVDAVHQATYRSGESKDKPPSLDKALLRVGAGDKSAAQGVLNRAQVMSTARSLVKDLANRPANLKQTDTMVETARAIAKKGPVDVKVQSNLGWIQKNMPCFYTVARGSLATDPPKFIKISYRPRNPKKHIAVVGKSVMFDTGGYQVKPGDYMVTMKGDMTGGAVALGTMQGIAELQPQNVAVTVYLAATPNKIDSDAMLPDSIVDTTCGKKVEIRHTDAEGRLTLIDAVAQAMLDKPDEIITVATLTGAASAAVGYYIALMGNNEELRGKLEKAGKTLGEPIQTLDVNEDDFENIKSKLDGADIINTTQRKHRGAQAAGAFVMSGAPETMPMAHLDIAGADMTGDEKATGISLKTVLGYILQEDERLGGGTRTARVTAPATGKPAKKAPGKAPAKAATKTTKASAKPVAGKSAAAKSTKAAGPKKSAKPAAKKRK